MFILSWTIFSFFMFPRILTRCPATCPGRGQLLLQTVCVCSLMFSWAGCAPMCWHLLAITLPHTYKLFACAAWSFPWPCVPLCAGSGGEIFCHTLTICLHLQPDVFLVPVCPYVLAPVARYSATGWNIPVISTGGMEIAFRYKLRDI